MFGYGGLGIVLNKALEKFNVRFSPWFFQYLLDDYTPVNLSFNPEKIAEFLTLDYAQYKNGFSGQAQFILWLSNSFYFGEGDATTQDVDENYPTTCLVTLAHKMFRLSTVCVDKDLIFRFFNVEEPVLQPRTPRPPRENMVVKSI